MGRRTDASPAPTCAPSRFTGPGRSFSPTMCLGGEWEDAEPFGELHLQVRMRRIDGATYGLLARGGGPLAYGLVPTDLTLESLESGE